jgi:hypothetical protein
MNPVSAITAIAGMSSVPRKEVSHGPRIGLRQDWGRNGVAERRLERSADGSRDGRLTRSIAV